MKILSVVAFMLCLGFIGIVGVAIMHTCCRDAVVSAIPALDGRK